MSELKNWDEAMGFLSQFTFWKIKKSTSPAFEVVVRCHDGSYGKVWARKGESYVDAINRLKQKLSQSQEAS